MKLLEQVVLDWNKAQRIRDFVNHMEPSINDVIDENKRNRLREWFYG